MSYSIENLDSLEALRHKHVEVTLTQRYMNDIEISGVLLDFDDSTLVLQRYPDEIPLIINRRHILLVAFDAWNYRRFCTDEERRQSNEKKA